VASRTDRGVSAVGNALALRSDLPGSVLLRQLNGIEPAIFFSAATPIADNFRVRGATRRTYRYFRPVASADVPAWKRAATLFRGSIDVRSFGRAIPSNEPCRRSIERLTVRQVPGGLCIEVRAPSFVWGMVRKIVGALGEHAAGRLPLGRLEAALHGEKRLSLPLAGPEGLVLWKVEYPIPWTTYWGGPNRHQTEFVQRNRESMWTQARVHQMLFSAR